MIPPLPTGADSASKPLILRRIEALASRLRRRQLVGSREVAIEVVRLLKEVVAGARISSFEQLTEHIEHVGKALQEAGPKELVVTNMTRRILKFLHEEYATALKLHLENEDLKGSTTPSPRNVPATPFLPSDASTSFPFSTPSSRPLGNIFDLLGHKSPGTSSLSSIAPTYSVATTPTPSSPNSPSGAVTPSHYSSYGQSYTQDSSSTQSMLADEFSRKSGSLKPVFIEAIQELMDEVELTSRSVGEQSIDHIHSGEFILTIGQSRTVEAFLKAASRKRKFTVIVAETAPSYTGRATALALSSAGIPTILIPDSNIFSLLPRCTKVLVSPHLVLADGALLSIAGSLPLCLAANRMRVPVVVVSGMFKFSASHLGEGDWGMKDMKSPDEVLRLDDGGLELETEVLNPRFDLVPKELVDLYITNLGGHPSSLLYRLLLDMYGPP